MKVWSDAKNWGKDRVSSYYLKTKIEITNSLSLFLFLIGFVYGLITLLFNPAISWPPFLASFIGLLCIFLNKIGLNRSSRFLLGISPVVLDSFFHAYHVPVGEEPIRILLLSQVAFAFYPWAVSDLRDWKILIPSVVICSLVIIFQPFINDMFETTGSIGMYQNSIIISLTYFAVILIFTSCLSVLQSRTLKLEKELKTEQNLAEKTLIQFQTAQNQLLEKEKLASLAVLSSGVVHEVKQPIQRISGLIDELENLENPSAESRFIQESLTAISNNVKSAYHIIKGLHTFNSVESDKTQEENDIYELIETCFKLLSAELKPGSSYKIIAHDRIKVKLPADKLQHMFINLIHNAMLAIDKEEGLIQVEISYSEKSVNISIEDNGEGIPPEELSRIEKPFYTMRNDAQTTGLGLTIVNKVLKELKGQIKFSSTLGKGTTVSITLPKTA